MFQLILMIMAIILGLALTAMAVFYGADSLTESKVRADAVTIINQASQIEAAMSLYHAKNDSRLDIGGLSSNKEGSALFVYLIGQEYLKGVPSGNGGQWTLNCKNSANQAAFEASENPADCGAEGVSLSLGGIKNDQCSVINVLKGFKYEHVDRLGVKAAIGDPAPLCSEEPNAPCCDTGA